ncbi:hypothetical protein [Oceanicella actignis]|uniref:hypothetical protein n=1 Tax=Oceanicella actignis TaxID=1189325 RepID=UPI0011E73D39|nr:hypothetical protein [Oceanicella actignis]TYO89647.1 hypothetical protein LY05_01639 [Oceanicella actignis]
MTEPPEQNPAQSPERNPDRKARRSAARHSAPDSHPDSHPDSPGPLTGGPDPGPTDPAPARLLSAHGLVFACPFDVPGMAPAPPGARADVTARLGAVAPAALARAPLAGDCRILGPGRVAIEDAAFRALIEEGARITIDPSPAAGPGAGAGFGPQAARLLLGYGASAVLLHQRGGLPLHAAAVALPRGAALLLGPAGAGKSTLAAALGGMGFAMLADDLTALDDRAPGGPLVQPAIGTVKLWPDSARALGGPGARVPVEGMSKTILRTRENAPAPAPLRAIVVLDWLHPPEAAPETSEMNRIEALDALRGAIQRPALARALGREGEILARLAALAGRIPALRLARPRRYGAMPEVAKLIADCIIGDAS